MEKKRKPIGAIIGIILSLALIGWGISRSEYNTYFKKAVNVCLQCIGIG